MFDVANGNEFWATVVALSVIVFFGCVSFLYFTANPYPKRDWARLAVAISAGVLAVSALIALF
jgi:hypothetical protein